ncbi:MAG: hypothetical protein ACOC85_03915 [Thermoplasmatota archaeon]
MYGTIPSSGRDVPPISVAQLKDKNSRDVHVYRQLFLRALNDNQIFLLKNIDGENKSLTSFLEDITEGSDKALSTLKMNARILKNLELITYGKRTDPEPVRLTKHGEVVLDFLQRGEIDS